MPCAWDDTAVCSDLLLVRSDQLMMTVTARSVCNLQAKPHVPQPIGSTRISRPSTRQGRSALGWALFPHCLLGCGVLQPPPVRCWELGVTPARETLSCPLSYSPLHTLLLSPPGGSPPRQVAVQCVLRERGAVGVLWALSQLAGQGCAAPCPGHKQEVLSDCFLIWKHSPMTERGAA